MLDGCHHPNRLTRTSPFAYNVYFVSSYVDGLQDQLHSRMRCFSYSSRFNSSPSLKKVGNGVYTPDLRQQTDEWRSPNNILENSSGICCSRREDVYRSFCVQARALCLRASGKVADEAACYRRLIDSLSRGVQIFALPDRLSRRIATHLLKHNATIEICWPLI